MHEVAQKEPSGYRYGSMQHDNYPLGQVHVASTTRGSNDFEEVLAVVYIHSYCSALLYCMSCIELLLRYLQVCFSIVASITVPATQRFQQQLLYEILRMPAVAATSQKTPVPCLQSGPQECAIAGPPGVPLLRPSREPVVRPMCAACTDHGSSLDGSWSWS